MNQFMELLYTMLIPNEDNVYALVESKKGDGFCCYDVNASTLDIAKLNSLAQELDLPVRASEFKPERYGDSHFIYIGPPMKRKQLDVTKFFQP